MLLFDKVYVMTKSSLALTSLPPEATNALTILGEHLALARVRRNESQRQWSMRVGVSVPTLIRMERGDPSVSIGVYATALWLLGLSESLSEIAAPAKDLRALEADVRKVIRTREVRKQASMTAQMSKKQVNK